MDKEMLEVLKQIQYTLNQHTEEFKTLNSKVDSIDRKLEATYDELARTREDLTDIKGSIDKLKKNVDFVESATIKNLADIREIKKNERQA